MNSEIATRLAETIAWCSLHARAADAGISTRSPRLCPPVMAMPRPYRLRSLFELSGKAGAAVRAVCAARRQALAQLGIFIPPVEPHLAGGRILLTTIDTDACEAATDPSNGYYDLDDLPAWDTWFWHQPTEQRWGAIYCWVPEPLVELAQAGMDAIPVESVRWAKAPNNREASH